MVEISSGTPSVEDSFFQIIKCPPQIFTKSMSGEILDNQKMKKKNTYKFHGVLVIESE